MNASIDAGFLVEGYDTHFSLQDGSSGAKGYRELEKRDLYIFVFVLLQYSLLCVFKHQKRLKLTFKLFPGIF